MSEEFSVRELTEFEVSRDGRTVEALIVPWNRPIEVDEFIGGRPVAYREQFAPGAFERAEKGPHRVTFTWGHSDDFGNALGRGVSFTNSAEGEVGVFKLNAADAPKARELIGDLGLSVSFRSLSPLPGSERDGQLVTRRQVFLRHVASVPNPAYPDARILAMREADAVAEAEAAERAEQDAVLADALRLLRSCGQELDTPRAEWLDAYERDRAKVAAI